MLISLGLYVSSSLDDVYLDYIRWKVGIPIPDRKSITFINLRWESSDKSSVLWKSINVSQKCFYYEKNK